MSYGEQVPVWFWIVAVVLTIWNAIGCYFCFQQFRLGADAMGGATDYDRALFAKLPGWYNYCYAIAVGAGMLGGIALLARSATAHTLFIISLFALVIQFGYLFATTDIIKQKGFGKVVPFPAFIAVVGVIAIWFAAFSRARGWIG